MPPLALQTADERTGVGLAAAGALLVASAAVLAGCVQQRPPAPSGQADRLAPGMGFFLNSTEDEGLKLAYGRANSDDVWLMLQCRPGSRTVQVLDMRHGGARRGDMLVLTSGKMQSALAPEFQPNPEAGGTLAVAHTTPGLPALDSFRHTGAIAVKLGGKEYALSATPGEKVQIARFFSACEKK